MACRIHIGLFTVMMVAATALPAGAQLLPQVTPKSAKPPATKPAQIVVETSPNAKVYLDNDMRLFLGPIVTLRHSAAEAGVGGASGAAG